MNLLSHLAQQIDEVLLPLIPAGTPCALVGFPQHPNVGDSAIWLGETSWLARRGVQIVYSCDTSTYSARQLATLIGNGIILIHGGGNLGDLWGHHQALRERVIKDFPDRPIIQLPQTIYFRQQDSVDRACQIFDAHPELTILCRDQPSLNFAQQRFRARSQLCPDMAFALGPLPRAVPPDQNVLWLARTDEESQAMLLPQTVDGVQVADWLDEPITPLHDQAQEWARQIRKDAENWRATLSSLMATYDALAAERMRRGCKLLGRGRVVITDRLHGHILCLLQGIPHVLFDNSYGKNRSFYDAWTQACSVACWASSSTEALVMAQRMLRKTL